MQMSYNLHRYKPLLKLRNLVCNVLICINNFKMAKQKNAQLEYDTHFYAVLLCSVTVLGTCLEKLRICQATFAVCS